MYENTVIRETFPDRIIPEDKFDKLQPQFINTISENKLSIAQVRYLFSLPLLFNINYLIYHICLHFGLLHCHCLPIFLDKIPKPIIDVARLMVDILEIFVLPHMGHLGIFWFCFNLFCCLIYIVCFCEFSFTTHPHCLHDIYPVFSSYS